MKALKLSLLVSVVSLRFCFAAPFAYINDFDNNVVYMLDTANNVVVATIPVGNGPFSVAATPDGSSVYVTNLIDSTVSVIDTSSRTVTNVITVGSFPEPVAISPDGTTAYVGNAGDNTISVINTSSKSVIQTVNTASTSNGLTVTPDGAELYSSEQQPQLFEYFQINSSTGLLGPANPISDGSLTPQVITSARTSGGQFVFALAVPSGIGPPSTFQVIDTSTHLLTNPPIGNLGFLPVGIAVTPDGTSVYTGTDSVLNVISTSPYAIVATIPDSSGSGIIAGPIAFTPDGLRAYVVNSQGATSQGLVNVIDTQSQVIIATITLGSNQINDIAIPAGSPSPNPISSPTNLTGRQKSNDFGTLFELFNQLQWQSGSPSTDGFKVYRDGALIATLGPTSLSYEDHNRPQGVKTMYAVTAFSSSGSESSPITVTIR